MKIASVVQNHFINDNRVWRSADALQAAGHEVMVVCIHREGLPVREEVNGVQVHRIKVRSQKLPRGKVLGLLKFIEMYTRIILKYRKWDAWHCNDFNPYFMGVIARKLNRKLKLVYDSHEYQTGRIDKSPMQLKFIAKKEKQHIQFIDAVILVSDGIGEEYKRLYGVKEVSIIRNVPHKIDVPKSRVLRDTFGIRDDQTLFLFQGNLGLSRGAEHLIEAFGNIEDDRAVLVILGSGKFQPMAEEYAAKHANIFYHTPVPYQQLLEYSTSADIGVVSSQNICLNNYYSLPNKLFEYIQSGLPVLTNNLIECEKLVNHYDIGVVVDGWTVPQIEKAVAEVVDADLNAFRTNLKKAQEELHWDKEKEKLLAIYNKL